MAGLRRVLASLGISRIYIINCGVKRLAAPEPIGSYPSDDVTFLLKDLSSIDLERPTENRERAIQAGVHYSEMLPMEFQPTAEYLRIFHETLHASGMKVAKDAGTVAELIAARRGEKIVLVSLARAGTPIGVLIKRYLKQTYGWDIPHYSISILRGKGMDENALLYIHQNHPGAQVQFVDGWTGKGAITRELKNACERMNLRYGVELSPDLAVLADPGHCSATFGTREDYLIPSACLNSTVSGLVSRTVLRDDLIGPSDFHGAKYYKEWQDHDVSNLFVDTIAGHFLGVTEAAKAEAEKRLKAEAAMPWNEMVDGDSAVTWQGMEDIIRIQQQYVMDNINRIKPGVGETTRVLLRRVPWKILVDRLDNPELKSILQLAKERHVPVEVYPEMTYACCGLIQGMGGGAE
ncbi:cysteine protease StiP family protein [Paenibacillus swuensis]